ncbi:hypothetical protein KAR91_40870 [Candidatus Pacearchaeota archaeon]|nr:hypothetical protein [Candidatus Pacearchaeota archaeon]
MSFYNSFHPDDCNCSSCSANRVKLAFELLIFTIFDFLLILKLLDWIESKLDND